MKEYLPKVVATVIANAVALFGILFLLSIVADSEVQAHDASECPPPPTCPPEGYILVEIQEEMLETQPSYHDALQTIQEAQEALKPAVKK